MSTPLSTFSSSGLDIGSNDRNLTYLYGLSDFFSFIFEDTDTVNLMLEANAVKASDIYSKFLQLTSALTIEGIQEQVGSSIELILIEDVDQVGVLPKFLVKRPFASAKFISNRPFLPTELLENNVDFRITQVDLDSCYIQFAKPISEYKFSQRILPSGNTQYALWITDVAIDEQLMYKHYGKLLGYDPEKSSEQFSNFIYGLYYLYLSGPTLSVLEQGLNLVLGIPLPRNASSVLDIRTKVETGQYLVITEDKEYLLPVGVLPSVGIGDLLDTSTPIAKWVELKDFVSDGKWWINVSIPSTIIRHRPLSQEGRFAQTGNRYDQLMSEHLYKNTFLIRINVGSFTDNRYFTYLSDILSKAKPSYTQAVFVWKIDMTEADFGSIEEISFTIQQIISTLRSINSYAINEQSIL